MLAVFVSDSSTPQFDAPLYRASPHCELILSPIELPPHVDISWQLSTEPTAITQHRLNQLYQHTGFMYACGLQLLEHLIAGHPISHVLVNPQTSYVPPPVESNLIYVSGFNHLEAPLTPDYTSFYGDASTVLKLAQFHTYLPGLPLYSSIYPNMQRKGVPEDQFDRFVWRTFCAMQNIGIRRLEDL